jgi:Na+-translocating ferredoxin:NAD+ oxidoreductase RnfD subunit
MSGPPWIGPLVNRRGYERWWLAVSAIMLVAATIFFGFRGLFLVCLTASVAMASFGLSRLVLRMVRGAWPPASMTSALHMGLMTGLTMPVMSQPWLSVAAGILVGVAVHVVGPIHRIRVHPVALVQLVLLLVVPLTGRLGVDAVLAPSRVVVGDVVNNVRTAGATVWINTAIPPGIDAIRRPAPDQILLEEQQRVLHHATRLLMLIKGGDLPRLADVLLGAAPGPVGATSAGLLIVLGLGLMHLRLGSWRMSAAAIMTVVLLMPLLPVDRPEGLTIGSLALAEMGWRLMVTYLSYQVLATPLLLFALILAPATMPRSKSGRVIYGVILGLWFATMRWFVPHEDIAYTALIVAGLLSPVLDRVGTSPFVATSRN